MNSMHERSSLDEESREALEQERRARSLALEKVYVHDVYDQIADDFKNGKHKAWPRVNEFLLELEPGSIVADVGCGNGKYLNINPSLCMLGSDRCSRLAGFARQAAGRCDNEVVIGDNLHLPFKQDSCDAVLSIAVVHHFATTERRVQALKELARILRIGGKVMISVWAKEQRHRKFESQDVLVPWHRQIKTIDEDCGSSAECEFPSTTTTSDEDVLTYHAYTQNTSDSGDSGCRSSGNSTQRSCRCKKSRRSSKCVAPLSNNNSNSNSNNNNNTSHSSSELSSPNETCYSFMRRAIKRFSSGSIGPSSYGSLASLHCYRTCKRAWPVKYDSFDSDVPTRPRRSNGGADSANDSSSRECSFDSDDVDGLPIELRHLDDIADDAHFATIPRRPHFVQPIKSSSLGDILGLLHMFLRPKKPWGSLSSDSESSGSWCLMSLRHRDQTKNGLVKSRSSYGLLTRSEVNYKQPCKDAMTTATICNSGSDFIKQDGKTKLGSVDEDDGSSCKNLLDDDEDQINGNSIAEQDYPRHDQCKIADNHATFRQFCSKIVEENGLELAFFDDSPMPRCKSMPNLRLRSHNHCFRKQSSLDERHVSCEVDSNLDDDDKFRGAHYENETDTCDKRFATSVRQLTKGASPSTDVTYSQMLNSRRETTKRHISCDDTALLSSSGQAHSHLWTFQGRTATVGRQATVLSPRLSTGSSSQQSDTSFDSEDSSIISVIAAKPWSNGKSDVGGEVNDSFDDPNADGYSDKNSESPSNPHENMLESGDAPFDRTDSDESSVVPFKNALGTQNSRDASFDSSSSSGGGSSAEAHRRVSPSALVSNENPDDRVSSASRQPKTIIDGGSPTNHILSNNDNHCDIIEHSPISNASKFQTHETLVEDSKIPEDVISGPPYDINRNTNDGHSIDASRIDDEDDEMVRSNSNSSDETPEDFTFHRYYHVFREGELDQLIDEFVDSLHIISSYYDHANWCVIAEKVQVWKI